MREIDHPSFSTIVNQSFICSRLTVYLKTMGDQVPPPSKRRKIIESSEKLRKPVKTSQSGFDANDKCNNANNEDLKDQLNIKEEILDDNSKSSNFKTPGEVDDEFAPETVVTNDNNDAENIEIKAENFSICDKNHWVHLFSDKDVGVECILTEQLLQIRNSFQSSFEGMLNFKIFLERARR